MNNIFWLVPVSSALALFFAWFFFKQMMKESEGTDTMKKIAKHVRDGAMAYLKQQYKSCSSGIHYFDLIVCCHGILIRNSKSLGALCVFNGWFLFRISRLLRNADSNLCICPRC